MCNKTDKTEERLRRLLDVMSIQSRSRNVTEMNKFIRDQLNEMGDVKFHFHQGNIYAIKGIADSYPCVVAHTDTVHRIIDDFRVFIMDDLMYAMNGEDGQQAGIGGDDKVGIYVALEMLRNHDVMKCAFFRDEEVGCIGSSKSSKVFFKNVEFVLQCDRRGYKDFVRKINGKWLHDDKFADKIAPILDKFSKEEELMGGSTDVGQLHSRGVDVCMANISCGYYRPHMDDEVISISEVFLTTNFVNELILTLEGKVWKNSDYKKSTTTTYYGNNRVGKKVWCHTAGEWVKPKDRVLMKYQDPNYVFDIHLRDYVRKDWLETVTWNGYMYVAKDLHKKTVYYKCPKCSDALHDEILQHIPITGNYYCVKCDKYYQVDDEFQKV